MADELVQLEVWWNKDSKRQAYAGAVRAGQERKVEIFCLIGKKSTSSTELLSVQSKKVKVNNKIINARPLQRINWNTYGLSVSKAASDINFLFLPLNGKVIRHEYLDVCTPKSGKFHISVLSRMSH